MKTFYYGIVGAAANIPFVFIGPLRWLNLASAMICVAQAFYYLGKNSGKEPTK